MSVADDQQSTAVPGSTLAEDPDEDLVDLPLVRSDRAASGFQGVYPQGDLWTVQFQAKEDGLKHVLSLGSYNDRRDAARVYATAFCHYYGRPALNEAASQRYGVNKRPSTEPRIPFSDLAAQLKGSHHIANNNQPSEPSEVHASSWMTRWMADGVIEEPEELDPLMYQRDQARYADAIEQALEFNSEFIQERNWRLNQGWGNLERRQNEQVNEMDMVRQHEAALLQWKAVHTEPILTSAQILEGWVHVGHPALWQKVSRRFPRYGTFTGDIVAYLPASETEPAFFLNIMEDGDKEELGLAEVERAISLYRKVQCGIVKPEPPPNIIVDGVKCGQQRVHIVADNSSLLQLAEQLDVQVKDLVVLNADFFEDLKSDTVIPSGTSLLLPDPEVAAAPEQVPESSETEEEDEESLGQVVAHEDESLRQVATRIQVDVSQLLALNKHRYKGLSANAKLQGGTILVTPGIVDEGLDDGQFVNDNIYYAHEDQTLRQVAEELGEEFTVLLSLNKSRIKGITANAKLMEGTAILLPELHQEHSPPAAPQHPEKRPRRSTAGEPPKKHSSAEQGAAKSAGMSKSRGETAGSKRKADAIDLSETNTYSAEDDETLKQIADKLQLDLSALLTLNKPRYKGLTSTAKLQEGTLISVPKQHISNPNKRAKSSSERVKSSTAAAAATAPPEAVSEYSAAEDETLKQIAQKFEIELAVLLTLNKPRYKGLTATAKLQEGTLILVPGEAQHMQTDGEELKSIPWRDCHDAAAVYIAKDNETVKQIATKLSVSASELLKLNRDKYAGLSSTAKLQSGTVLLTPEGASESFTTQAVVVGNTQAPEGDMFNWTIFVRALDHNSAPDMVERVVFQLHPDFNPDVVELTEPPFQLSRKGWGSFDVGIEVVTKSGLHVEIEHPLNLNDPYETDVLVLKE